MEAEAVTEVCDVKEKSVTQEEGEDVGEAEEETAAGEADVGESSTTDNSATFSLNCIEITIGSKVSESVLFR